MKDQNLEQLINDLPLQEADKEHLRQQAESGDTEGLFKSIDETLKAATAQLDQEEAAIDKDAEKEMEEARKEFEANMDGLDKESDQAAADAQKEIDALRKKDLE